MTFRKVLATASAATLMTAGLGFATAAPASAQQSGLVNVNVEDVNLELLNDVEVRVLNNLLRNADVNVGVVAAITATVCDVNVGGILGTLRDTGSATCETAGGPIEFEQVA